MMEETSEMAGNEITSNVRYKKLVDKKDKGCCRRLFSCRKIEVEEIELNNGTQNALSRIRTIRKKIPVKIKEQQRNIKRLELSIKQYMCANNRTLAQPLAWEIARRNGIIKRWTGFRKKLSDLLLSYEESMMLVNVATIMQQTSAAMDQLLDGFSEDSIIKLVDQMQEQEHATMEMSEALAETNSVYDVGGEEVLDKIESDMIQEEQRHRFRKETEINEMREKYELGNDNVNTSLDPVLEPDIIIGSRRKAEKKNKVLI